jgi:hypothetical protein
VHTGVQVVRDTHLQSAGHDVTVLEDRNGSSPGSPGLDGMKAPINVVRW